MLYSVWNCTQNAWSTSTNYSTPKEALDLLKVIKRQCHDQYEVKGREFGTIGEK